MPRGGNRPGSGRPKTERNYSEEVKRDFLKAAKQKAKETGQSLGQVVINLIYDEKIQDSVRLAAIKVWADIVVVKESKQKIEEQRPTGLIVLPEIKPLPERLIKPESKETRQMKH